MPVLEIQVILEFVLYNYPQILLSKNMTCTFCGQKDESTRTKQLSYFLILRLTTVNRTYVYM